MIAFAAALLAAAPVQGMASEMSVGDFLTLSDALVARGPAAIGSPEADRLQRAMRVATDRYRRALAAETARGATPTSCPPPPGQASLSLGEVRTAFRALPPADRDVTLTAAVARLMRDRYPCR